MNWYYEIWADGISGIEKSKSYMTKGDKIFVIFSLFTAAQAANFATILLILNFFFDVSYFLHIDIFRGRLLDSAFEGIITLFSPFALLNYFLVLHKKRYEKFVENCRLNTGGKAFLLYAFCSFILFLLIVITGKWVL